MWIFDKVVDVISAFFELIFETFGYPDEYERRIRELERNLREETRVSRDYANENKILEASLAEINEKLEGSFKFKDSPEIDFSNFNIIYVERRFYEEGHWGRTVIGIINRKGEALEMEFSTSDDKHEALLEEFKKIKELRYGRV